MSDSYHCYEGIDNHLHKGTNDERKRPDLRNRDRNDGPGQRRPPRRPADRTVQTRNPGAVPARGLEGRGRRLDQQRPRRTPLRDRQPDPSRRRRDRPGGRGPPHAGGQRPSGQRELWSSCSRRLAAGFAERGPGPAGDDRRLRREGPLRDHRIEEPGTRNVLRRRPQIRERQRRQAEPRPQPLPRLEPDEPGPRDKGHGRVPRVLRLAQPGEGGRLDSGLPGLGRAGHQREADADLEPQAA